MIIRISKAILLLTTMAMLASCQAIENRKAEIRANRAAADHSSCIAKGFTKNTDAFRLCLDNRNIERQVQAAERAADDASEAAASSCRAGGGYWYGSLCVY